MSTNVKTCNESKLCTHKITQDLDIWVYSGLCENQIFKRFDNMLEAVSEAVKYKDAHVLYNGMDIKYGIMGKNILYYICINTNEAVILGKAQE